MNIWPGDPLLLSTNKLLIAKPKPVEIVIGICTLHIRPASCVAEYSMGLVVELKQSTTNIKYLIVKFGCNSRHTYASPWVFLCSGYSAEILLAYSLMEYGAINLIVVVEEDLGGYVGGPAVDI